MIPRPDHGPAACLRDHVAPRLAGAHPRPSRMWAWVADCPACGGGSKLSIEPGTKGARFLWSCCGGKGCPAHVIRHAVLALGISADCLGGYAARPSTPDAPDARLAAALDRLAAVEKVLARTDLRAPADLRIAIAEALDGKDAPTGWGEFLAFAERAGVQQSKRYEAAARWGVRRLSG